MALQSASAPADKQLHGGASHRAESNGKGDTEEPPVNELMNLVRRHLYIPDGHPPVIVVKGHPWTEARERNVLRELLRHRSNRDVATAIEGLALLRDHPGVYADQVDWLKHGEKVTLRALHNSRSGVTSMFALATQAYWKHQNTRREEPVDNGGPARIGEPELSPACTQAPQAGVEAATAVEEDDDLPF